MGFINQNEYLHRKEKIIDSYIDDTPYDNLDKTHYFDGVGANWRMPKHTNRQVTWLNGLLDNAMPRSYDDVLPATGKSFWATDKYLISGAFDPELNQTVPFDSQVAIQERALTHVGLNLYDGGVWSIALALNGFSDIVDVYFRNTLYTSTTGSNPFADGLANIRASSPAKDYHYGKSQISDKDLTKVAVPGNQSYVHLKDHTCCGVCCEVTSERKIPGGYYYRMIGPKYKMHDPLNGDYGWVWRSVPAGPNNDTTTSWNLAGIIHWNDWKPITGENVWGLILGPLQVMFIRNCSNTPSFSTYDDTPHEVQLALSILPACEAMLSPLGSMYHCPKGTQMFPTDPDEKTNVSNENNFSAHAAFMALMFVLENYYTGSDPVLDAAKLTTQKLIDGLESWFKQYLLPGQINGKNVISQGGHVSFTGDYEPQGGDQAFAVDCQTWGLLVLGATKFDSSYQTKTTAYQIWQDVKELAGFYINGKIAGVGYTTTQKKVWSGEWSWGAVFMVRRLSYEYAAMGKTSWANELKADYESMIQLMSAKAEVDKDGVWKEGGGLVQIDGSYVYANDRFFIPWGWYANPIGSTASTGWSVFNDYKYNPFILGGGRQSTFFNEQCKGNEPDPALLDKLNKFYNI